jgi:hypothetical protein
LARSLVSTLGAVSLALLTFENGGRANGPHIVQVRRHIRKEPLVVLWVLAN